MNRVIGLETSCDETSAAVVARGATVLSNVVASQAHLHARWGGVVPEVASRMHVERMLPVIVEALERAETKASDIEGIAVTNRPGLVGALVVGVACAKALALAWKVPVVGVHHLVGHLYAARLACPALSDPFLCLVVSGGHTELIWVQDADRAYVVGRTKDDAAGECFDKSARLLGLPYPGGPALERLASGGDPGAVRFPRAWLGDTLDFSFSGLKTAVARFVAEDRGQTPLPDVAASLQQAIIDVLVQKTLLAAERLSARAVALGGGVAANSALKRAMQVACEERGIACVVPPAELCTDNAAMIAAAAWHRLERGESDGMELDALATEYLPAVAWEALR